LRRRVSRSSKGFEQVIISGDLRVTKPDPRIYRELLERVRLRPEATVFIDDSIANVEAARRLGVIGLHFSEAGALRRDLAELGLPLRPTTARANDRPT
jgi:2-haloacid dehalogenase